MTKETIQKEHRILQLKYAVLAVVVGICVGIVDTIFGRGLLAISVSLHWTVEYGREREIITGSDGYSTKCIPAECR